MASWTMGPFVLEPDRGTLTREGQPIGVQPLVLQLLVHAAQNPGQLLIRAHLSALLWPDVVVTDHSLTQLSHQVRKALGEHRAWWVTVPRRGYRYDGPATRIDPLPSSPDALFGRRDQLDAIEAHWDGGARWVLLHGPGGIGKTRLGREVLERTEGWTLWVDLVPARSEAALIEEVAAALEVDLARTGAAEQVGRALARQGPGLVVLDNLEQLESPCTGLLERWAQGAPDLRWVGTSRALIPLPGIEVVAVPPLRGPDAAALFAARAGASLATFDRTVLGAIVQALEGLPLSIELAAARSEVLDLPAILSRIDRQLALLGGGVGPPRHKSMRAAIGWSWELLDPPAQRVLAICALFSGSFTVALVEAVFDQGEPGEVLDALHALKRQSLIHSVRPGGLPRAKRLTMHQAVRDYATEALPLLDPDLRLRRAFRDVIRDLNEAGLGLLRRWDPELADRVLRQSASAPAALALCDPPDPDFAAAVAISLHLCERLAGAEAIWVPHRDVQTPRAVLARLVLSLPTELDTLLPPTLACVGLHVERGEHADASVLLRLLAQRTVTVSRNSDGLAFAIRARHLADEAGDRELQAWACLPMAGAQMRMGEREEALKACARGLGIVDPRQTRLRASLLDVEGVARLHSGDHPGAERVLTEALRLAEETGLRVRAGSIRMNLASLLQTLGRLQEAILHAEEVVQHFRRLGWAHAEAVGLNNLGFARLLSGDPEGASHELDRALALGENPYVQMLVDTNRCAIALCHRDYNGSIDIAKRALEALGEEQVVHRSALLLYLAAAAVGHGDSESARGFADQAAALPQQGLVRGGLGESWSLVRALLAGEPVPHTRSPLARLIGDAVGAR